MKTIYICSEYFAPYHNIGSMKFSKIAKFLSRNNEYRIYVFSRKNFSNKVDWLLQDDLDEIERNHGKIFFIDAGKKYYKQPLKLYSRLYKVWHIITGYNMNYYVSNVRSAKKFCKNAINIIERNHLPKPDYIISTYDDWGSHYLARNLKKRLGDQVIWISDFRDPVGAAIKKGTFRKLCDKYTYSITKESDFTTVISEGLLNCIKMHPETKTLVATNGFDYEDYRRVMRDKEKLHFVYTGSFYHQKRTLIPVFQAIRELIDEGKMEERLVSIEYAGGYGTKVYSEVCKYGLEKCWLDWGEITRYQSILLQDRGDILMTSVWNLDNDQGVLAGKTLEYLMLKKPIIAIVSGTLGNSSMKKFIEETNCGICYEETEHDIGYARLKNQILEYYIQKQKRGKVDINYSNTVENYNFENIAKTYSEIML